VIEKLYDRGYLEDDPPRPTQLAMAVVEAAEEYADLVVSEEMTRELEEEMTAIVEGEKHLEDVTADSRAALDRIFDSLAESRDAIGEHLRSSLKADRTLGPCPECGSNLLVRQNRQGSYFVGCDGYPDCEFTAPLPNRGEPQLLDEVCETHDLHHVKMLDGRSTFVHGCPLCKVEDADAAEDEVIGTCPECGEDHGGDLAIKHLRNGSRLVGCTRYPDCEYAVPLPRRGEIEVTEDRCEEHDLPELRIHDGSDDPWEFGCPICNYREYVANQNGDLTSIDGIGDKTAEKLSAAGIETVSDLLEIDPAEVAPEIDGVSAERLADWQQSVG
jgi:DNA topoisomerase-1